MRRLVLLIVLASASYAQDSTIPAFPATPMPPAVTFLGHFNQIGSPRFTGSVSGWYPISGQYGLYGTSGLEFYPQKAIDGGSGKQFIALQATIQQELYKTLLETGRYTFMMGINGGPVFGSDSTGFKVSASGGGAGALVIQMTPVFSFVMAPKLMWISGAGWNPIVRAGFQINLKKLPPKK